MAIRFDEFVLDVDARELTFRGRPLPLTPKALQLLQILFDERPRVVPKGELIDRLWPDVAVEEANLRNLVAEIRRTLNDDDRDPKYLRTAHRWGYAFVGSTRVRADRAVPRLHAAAAVYALMDGPNIIGRDPDCAVCLNASGISRRHVCIDVSARAAKIQDLGSKNGTWVNGVRLQSEVELHDGDQIQIGKADLTFRTTADARSTTTVDGPR